MTDERDSKKYLLPAPKFCGRGVEIVDLDIDEKDAAHEAVASCMAQDSGGRVDENDFLMQQKYKTLVVRECIRRMIRAVTVQKGLTLPKSGDPREVLLDPKVQWKPVNVDILESDPVYSYKALFGRRAIDDQALQRIFGDTHGFDAAEIDSIVGKALAVSGDGPGPTGSTPGTTGTT